MSNTITAFFKGRVGVCESVYQHDYGLVMVIDGIDGLTSAFDCYFSTTGDEEAMPAIGANNRVAIPNNALSKSGDVTLHIPLHQGENDSEVEYVVTFRVIGRAKPVDDGSEEEQSAISQAIALLKNPTANIEQIVNEALSFTGDTFAEMQEQLDADQAAYESDMDARADAFETTMGSQFSTAMTRVDNLLASDSNSAVTLYNNPNGFLEGTITLAQPITNFDFLDIFYVNGGSGSNRGGHSTRIPAVAGTYELRTWDADPPTTDFKASIEYGEQNVTISGSSFTAASNKQISFSIASQSSVVVNTGSYRYSITKIVGIKMGSASPAELTDMRVDANGSVYSTAGSAIRSQSGSALDSLYGVENFGIRNAFALGSLLNGAFVTGVNNRIASQAIMEYDRTLLVSVANGFRFSVHTFENGTFKADTGLSTATKLIPANTQFKICIARVTEISGETASVETFLKQVTFTSTIGELGNSIANVKSELKLNNEGSTSMNACFDFANGSLSSGTFDANNKYRVATPDIVSVDKDVVLSVADGFRFSVHTFEDGIFKRDSGLTVDSKRVAAGTTFKMCIARVTENNSEIADVTTFAKQVTTTIPIKNELDETREIADNNRSIMLDGGYSPSFYVESGGWTAYAGSNLIPYTETKRTRVLPFSIVSDASVRVSFSSGFRAAVYQLDDNGTIIKTTNLIENSPIVFTAEGTQLALMFAKTDNSNISVEEAQSNLDITVNLAKFPLADSNMFGALWGKNYITKIYDNHVATRAGVDIFVNDDNSITLNGTATGNIDYYILGSGSEAVVDTALIKGNSYILSSGDNAKSNVYYRLKCVNGSDLTEAVGSDINFVMGDSIKLILRIYSGVVFDNYTVYPMIRNAGFNDDYEPGFDRSQVLNDIHDLNIPNISDFSDTVPYKIASLYNGVKFNKDVDWNTIVTVGNDDYGFHDGTLLLYNNRLYAIYCRYSGNQGDAAVNPTATVFLTVYDLSGNKLFDRIVAQNGDVHGSITENGGAGSPNGYRVDDKIYILYTAYIDSTYCEMCAVYDITNDEFSYDKVLVDGAALDNSWINEHFSQSYASTAYTSAQCNCTIADDGENYYIGWVCGVTSKLGKAIIFKTADFINWSVLYEYSHDIVPVYEMPLVYDDGCVYYAIRPLDNANGVIGKVRISDAAELDCAYFPNCSSRPLFFKWYGCVYMLTNPTNRNAVQIYRVSKSALGKSECVVDCFCYANYPSFALDEENYQIYMLRSNSNMQITKFDFTLVSQQDVQYIFGQLFGFYS